MNKENQELSDEFNESLLINENTLPLLVYCDSTTDSAVMLAHILTSPHFEVRGVICCGDNVSGEISLTNAKQICEMAKREDVAIFSITSNSEPILNGVSKNDVDYNSFNRHNDLRKLQLPTPKVPHQTGDAIAFATQTIRNSSQHSITIISNGCLPNVYNTLVQLRNLGQCYFANIAAISMAGGVFDKNGHSSIIKNPVAHWADYSLISNHQATSQFFALCEKNNIKVLLSPVDLTQKIRFSKSAISNRKRALENPLTRLVSQLLSDAPHFHVDKSNHDDPSQPAPGIMATLCLAHPYLFTGKWVGITCNEGLKIQGLLVKRENSANKNVFVLNVSF